MGDSSQYVVLYCTASAKKRKVWLEGTLSVSASKSLLFNDQHQTVTVVTAQAPSHHLKPNHNNSNKDSSSSSSSLHGSVPSSSSSSSPSLSIGSATTITEYWKALSPAQCNSIFRLMTTFQPPQFPIETTFRMGPYDVQILEVKHAHLVPFVVPALRVAAVGAAANEAQEEPPAAAAAAAATGVVHHLSIDCSPAGDKQQQYRTRSFSSHPQLLQRPQQQQQQQQVRDGVAFSGKEKGRMNLSPPSSDSDRLVVASSQLPQKRSREELLQWCYAKQRKNGGGQ